MTVSNEDSVVASTQERRPQTEANASAQPSDGDVDYIAAALSWYDGGPASDDVHEAWGRLRARIHAGTELLGVLKTLATATAAPEVAMAVLCESVAAWSNVGEALNAASEAIAGAEGSKASQHASEPRGDAQRRATPVLNTGEGL